MTDKGCFLLSLVAAAIFISCGMAFFWLIGTFN